MLYLAVALAVSVTCNVFFVFMLLSASRVAIPSVEPTVEPVPLIKSVRPAYLDAPHIHYRWIDPTTGEVCYYGITSKDIQSRFVSDARSALSIVRRFQKLAEWDKNGLSPIVEVYDTSPSRKEASRKEKADIRAGIARGEPLMNSEAHSQVIRFTMLADFRQIEGPK